MPASADGSAIGRLVTQESSKEKTIVTYLGDHVMTFEVPLTRP